MLQIILEVIAIVLKLALSFLFFAAAVWLVVLVAMTIQQYREEKHRD